MPNRLTETPAEHRYDAETLGRVAALAQNLQDSDRQTLTTGQIEAIGEEVGLGRVFVRAALRQMALHESEDMTREARAKEFGRLIGGWSLCVIWSLLAWSAAPRLPGFTNLITLLASPLVAVGAGFLIGKQRAAMGAATGLAAALALVFAGFSGAASGSWPAAVLYLALGGPLVAWLGWQGARLREHYFPTQATQRSNDPSTQDDLLDLLVTVQRQLDRRADHRAFLSIDVAGAREIRRGASDALADHTFRQFQDWASALIHQCGGECLQSPNDPTTGVPTQWVAPHDPATHLLAIFPTDAGAVSAARQIQEGIDRFNADRNRLATPFRVRCGIASGAVAPNEERPPGAPPEPATHNPQPTTLNPQPSTLAQHAVALQQQADPGDIVVSGEVTAAALLDLRCLAPLRHEAGEPPAFSWRAGQRAQQRP